MNKSTNFHQKTYKHKLKNLKIGDNIRRLRTERNMSIDELALVCGLTSAFIGLIERNQRGCALYNLMQFSEIFDTPLEELIYGFNEKISIENKEAHIKNQLINSFLISLNEKELDFVIAFLRGLITMKNSSTKTL